MHLLTLSKDKLSNFNYDKVSNLEAFIVKLLTEMTEEARRRKGRQAEGVSSEREGCFRSESISNGARSLADGTSAGSHRNHAVEVSSDVYTARQVSVLTLGLT